MPLYKFANVIAYVVNNSAVICDDCLTKDDKITSVYDEDDQPYDERSHYNEDDDEEGQALKPIVLICDRCNKECLGSIPMWHRIVFDNSRPNGTIFEQVPGFDYWNRPGPAIHLQK